MTFQTYQNFEGASAPLKVAKKLPSIFSLSTLDMGMNTPSPPYIS
jgi:hypothetical protein